MNILRVTIVDVASEIAVSPFDVTVHGLMVRGKKRIASGTQGGMVRVDAFLKQQRIQLVDWKRVKTLFGPK